MEDFGFKHLVGLAWLLPLIAIMLVVTLLIRKKYNKGEEYDRKVVKYAAIFMWFWEFIKTMYIFKSTDYGAVGEYTAYMLPFHICSMALYAFAIVGFSKGKVANFVKPFAFSTMLIVTLIILTIPASSGILGDIPNWSFVRLNTLPYQSFLYHGSLVFVPLYMVISGFYRPKLSDIWKVAVVLAIVGLFAFSMNKYLTGTDFMMLEYGWGNPFNYLIDTNYFAYLLILVGFSLGGSFITLCFAKLGVWLAKIIKERKAKRVVKLSA